MHCTACPVRIQHHVALMGANPRRKANARSVGSPNPDRSEGTQYFPRSPAALMRAATFKRAVWIHPGAARQVLQSGGDGPASLGPNWAAGQGRITDSNAIARATSISAGNEVANSSATAYARGNDTSLPGLTVNVAVVDRHTARSCDHHPDYFLGLALTF